MKRKALRAFLREHRSEIDAYIRQRIGRSALKRTFNDDERYQWLLYDESLYNWARSEGVNL